MKFSGVHMNSFVSRYICAFKKCLDYTVVYKFVRLKVYYNLNIFCFSLNQVTVTKTFTKGICRGLYPLFSYIL